MKCHRSLPQGDSGAFSPHVPVGRQELLGWDRLQIRTLPEPYPAGIRGGDGATNRIADFPSPWAQCRSQTRGGSRDANRSTNPANTVPSPLWAAPVRFNLGQQPLKQMSLDRLCRWGRAPLGSE